MVWGLHKDCDELATILAWHMGGKRATRGLLREALSLCLHTGGTPPRTADEIKRDHDTAAEWGAWVRHQAQREVSDLKREIGHLQREVERLYKERDQAQRNAYKAGEAHGRRGAEVWQREVERLRGQLEAMAQREARPCMVVGDRVYEVWRQGREFERLLCKDEVEALRARVRELESNHP